MPCEALKHRALCQLLDIKVLHLPLFYLQLFIASIHLFTVTIFAGSYYSINGNFFLSRLCFNSLIDSFYLVVDGFTKWFAVSNGLWEISNHFYSISVQFC